MLFQHILLLLDKDKYTTQEGGFGPLCFNLNFQMSILSKKRSYTRVTIKEVMRLYNEGMNFTQIADELECARNTVRAKVRQYVKQTGKAVPTRTKPGLGVRDIKNILLWYEEGEKVSDIAEHFNVTISCIYKILQKYGD